MDMVNAYLQSIIPTILLVVIQAVVATAGIFVIRLLNKLLKRTGLDVDMQMMSDIEDIILKAVSITNQTLTDNFKAASKNHKLSDEQKAEVFNHTKEIIMSCLSYEQVQLLINKYGTDIDSAVKMLIENTVYWSKSPNVIETAEVKL